MTEFDFDAPVERRGTACCKWDDAPKLFRNPDILPMWVADMDFAAPPCVLSALSAQVRHGAFGYPAADQTPTVAAFAGWLERRHGWNVPLESVVLVPGVVPALQAAVEAFSDPGDEIIIQPPVYHPFFDIARSGGRVLVENPLVERDGFWQMDLDDLAAKAETAEILVLCNPHNPGGRAWTREELAAVAGICARTGTIVLTDEIHGDLVHAPHVHTPFASLGGIAPDRIATFAAPSKTFNLAGLNIAATIIPDAATRRRFEKVFRDRGVPCTNGPGLAAMRAAYEHGDPWLDALLAYLQVNSRHLVDSAAAWPGIRLAAPEATYLAWLDCRGTGMDEAQLVTFFGKEAQVGLNRGGMFGNQGRGWMRLNFGTRREILDEGIARIARALDARAGL